MLNRFRQGGAFLLVLVIFLMVAGGAMLYAMANLSTVSSATNSVVHNGNMALAAAQSGLKYCVAQLDTGDCANSPLIGGISTPAPAPCVIEITVGGDGNDADGACSSVAPAICTVTSTAYCPSAAEALRGARKISIQVQKTEKDGAFYYQMIPASRLVLSLP